MEYKLKKSEFYRVAYLVAGILMFLFLFGIFSLSSHAQSGSFHGWYAQENVQNESYISFLQNFDPNDFKGLSNPCFEHDWSFTITKTPISGSNDSNISVNMVIHVVTSDGDMVIGSFLCPNSGSYTQTFSGNGLCFGVPTYAYLEVIASTEWARIAGNYQIDSWSFTVTPKSFSYDNSNNFSDYSNYSPVNTYTPINSSSGVGYSFPTVPSGSPILLNFPDYTGNSFLFTSDFIYFMNTNDTDYTLMVNFNYPYANPSFTGALVVRDSNNVDVIIDSSPTIIATRGAVGNYGFTMFFNFHLSSSTPSLYCFNLNGFAPTNMMGVSYSFLSYKMTISDYMDYVQDQWSNISPNVTQTNSNIADSVSTVGTASTYESAQFTSFDNLVTQTGVDSFSLSTVSTPLLWVGGLITTCYNNLPSSIQYLLMFVGVFGLIVIILNSGSRVIRRFGGDS